MAASKSLTVNVGEPTEFILRSVKTKGLRPNMFNNKKTPGYQITVQVPEDKIEEIQEAWSSHKPKKPTPFFGLNDKNNMLTVKSRKISEKMKKECLAHKDATDSILVDIKFGITDIYIDDFGDKFPQLKFSGLRKVGVAEDDTPVPSDNF